MSGRCKADCPKRPKEAQIELTELPYFPLEIKPESRNPKP